MQDQWKIDLESEDHRSRRDMTEKSIARYVKGEVERQVTSSSTSSSVFVSDCTWIMGASVAQPSYLCCGLSNGSVCLLNTSNLSKIYLFEVDRDSRRSQRDSDRGGQGQGPGRVSAASQQLVAVATHTVSAGTNPAAVQTLLCMTLDNVVCVCPMDMSTVLERKKVSRSDMAKVKPFPAVAAGAVLHSSVHFNSKGSGILALLCIEQESSAAPGASSIRYCAAVLSSPDETVTLQSKYASEDDWHTLAPPSAGGDSRPGAPVELCYCGWWSADTLVCVWSNSALQFLQAAGMQVVGECGLLHHCTSDAVTNATVTRPGAAEASDGASSGLIAVVLDHNVAASFYVTVRHSASASAQEPKRHRIEAFLTVTLTPTMQTYCTEDIPIRELHLVRSFSWTIVLLLESGALVFLDAETMRLSVHRPVNRLRAPDAGRYHAGPLMVAPRNFFCVLSGKPFSAVVVEHNTAILLKSQ
ncbi:hypothetical protein conserved [Leishmania donovani]|uniref:Uncharacterized protein n=3 Tax=Leishmania donovani species complex TaxID=38574 RepID=A4I359_LEIIN|nr:conserved hypothetical protein [Leishmania infantum JPCM5]XP_003861875.1 hypothetical protein, conserved [Leishmania donovani]CAC9498526.1 hypothetical_protein_-_conserved [Leishmania infantum]AYU79896.1 hypothetical protein LdCL_270006600 [Leishmania donovani]TPP47629.1 hypothetical protein CGC21_31355 [Leishmania donovani]CAJ1989881.1 hypothetical protein conserved [Leishmania donovani]CAM69213.1 conserved hypothetical protein [Leishmania infantum JPCM5]|eukprot:XP_001466492.1 conserved hypothetical protein [Leishmania infantum JPCM5]